MIRRTVASLLLAALLGGCSYSYDLIATVMGGQIVIAVDPASSRHPLCMRQIEVSSEDESESVWLESVDYDDGCANRFPLTYGTRLRGRHQADVQEVKAKPLRRQTIYEVTATTGATGYGGGRFIIRADGTVRNLRPKFATAEIDNQI